MLVSVDDLTTYMDIKFSNRQERAAEFVLAGLQSELESYLRRPIEVNAYTEDHVIPSDFGSFPVSSHLYNLSLDTTGNPPSYVRPAVTVYMRNSPVVAVTSVQIQPVAGGASITAEAGTDYVAQRYGIDLYRAMPNDRIRVSYTAGLSSNANQSLPVFRLLILRAASREMQNMHDDVVGLKDLETRNVGPLTTGFTEEELQSVRRWRRIRIG
jgi:hypothetical protein